MKTDKNNDMFSSSYLELGGVEDKSEYWTHYSYNGIGIPRVTEILDSTIGRQYLNNWAASLGSNYKSERQKILDTGTMAHAMIEDYLIKGYIKESYNLPNADSIKAYKCFHNFVNWYKDMEAKGYKVTVIVVEKVLTCPYYGGTCDCIANITEPDGTSKNYILDFKTSKSIDYSYYLQTMFYTKAIQYNHINGDLMDIPDIDGIGIIRVDKIKNNYEYLIADFERDPEFIQSVDAAAMDMLYWFYRQINIQYEYKQFRKLHLGR